MHPLHEHIAAQIAEEFKSRRVVVWYDPRGEFRPFVEELRGGAVKGEGELVAVEVGGRAATLVEYKGSFYAVRAAVEPRVAVDAPDPTLIYVSGVEHTPLTSPLMELETAGECWTPQKRSLRRFARAVLRKRFTDAVIDDMLEPEGVTYEDLASASAEKGAEAPSILKAIFSGIQGDEAIIAAWIASDVRDREIEAKEAKPELTKVIRACAGLEVVQSAPLAKMRMLVARYVLASEFRADLECPPPASLDSVPTPLTKEHLLTVKMIGTRLRAAHADAYPAIADRVEAELGVRDAGLPGGALGRIDTFRFEEEALLAHAASLIASGKQEAALEIVGAREKSFWLDRDVARKAQWEACRAMAELARLASSVRAEIAKTPGEPREWVNAYVGSWNRLDRVQRRLESLVGTLEHEPDERALGVVRRAYEDTIAAMADGFRRALEKAQWTVPGALQQTQIFADAVEGRPQPMAYFLVDALRFEMGCELAERLSTSASEFKLRPALAALPTITPIGMAALLPGAAASFSVVEQGGKFGAKIDGAFLPDLPARKKFLAARVPGAVDLTLDDVLGLPKARLEKKLGSATLVVVRSQEIDLAGETSSSLQARRTMDSVIENLARAVRKLAGCGIADALITADHGHLFFPAERDESLRVDSPGGKVVDLHRRCWIGHGGATPGACTRVNAAGLGYPSDLDLVFPGGCAVFKAGGDLFYCHGGTSLQEMVIPLLFVRAKSAAPAKKKDEKIAVTGLPKALTNRIFSVSIELGKQLFGGAMSVRPLLVAGEKRVGAPIVAVNAELDRETKCVSLTPGKPATVGFMLTDDDPDAVRAVRVLVQDPNTDAELFRSDEIPVRLGV